MAGLHQFCAPMLAHLDRLSAPPRDAPAMVFGRSAGVAPDGFLVGLATLTLVAEVGHGHRDDQLLPGLGAAVAQARRGGASSIKAPTLVI